MTLQSAVTAQVPSARSEVARFIPQVAEAPGAAKCIGPGCASVAQPDSVYCSNDCILKHAAAAMKFLSAGKDPKPKPREKTKAKAEKLALPKGSAQVRLPWQRVNPRCSLGLSLQSAGQQRRRRTSATICPARHPLGRVNRPRCRRADPGSGCCRKPGLLSVNRQVDGQAASGAGSGPVARPCAVRLARR